MAFIKSLSRLLGSKSAAPQLHLAAFGKHPGWNDHADDMGLDTEALITAKTLLYMQGISQNIDSGAWDKLEATPEEETADPTAPPAPATLPDPEARLDLFRHDFLWHMPGSPAPLLAGRLWSSSDGKGRDKYPMVACAHLSDLPLSFSVKIVLPLLAQVQEKCEAAVTADAVREIIDAEREALRAHIGEPLALRPLAAAELAAVASHPDMHEGRIGFHRIVYQFASGMDAFRTAPAKNAAPRRPEQLRLPTCGLSPEEALFFWLRFGHTFLDPSSPILLFAPDQRPRAPWVDLIAGDPSPSNLFCIKAGTKSLPFTSDIPYTLDPAFVESIESHLAACAASPDSPLPPWPL